jgi:hypothetical protein
VNLSDEERAILNGHHGEALRRSMEGLVQLGEAFRAEDMIRIGYAHVHPGTALYAQDVELLEELVSLGTKGIRPDECERDKCGLRQLEADRSSGKAGPGPPAGYAHTRNWGAPAP